MMFIKEVIQFNEILAWSAPVLNDVSESLNLFVN